MTLDFELLTAIVLIILNLLLIIYTFNNKDNQKLEYNNCDKIVEKVTNLPILIVKIAFFFLIIFILSFITFILESFQIQFLKDILEFSLDCFVWHFLSYFIYFIRSKKYDFIKCQIYYILMLILKYIFKYLLKFF